MTRKIVASLYDVWKSLPARDSFATWARSDEGRRVQAAAQFPGDRDLDEVVKRAGVRRAA